jgi:hypothetical protein
MKKISIVAAVAAFVIVAGISSVTGSAAVGPDTALKSGNQPVVMPVSQELPFDRYWSKD